MPLRPLALLPLLFLAGCGSPATRGSIDASTKNYETLSEKKTPSGDTILIKRIRFAEFDPDLTVYRDVTVIRTITLHADTVVSDVHDESVRRSSDWE